MTNEKIQELARRGAAARLVEMDMERRDIFKTFPGLGAQVSKILGMGSETEMESKAPAALSTTSVSRIEKRGGRRRKISTERRKEISQRMKRYWAERRAGK